MDTTKTDGNRTSGHAAVVQHPVFRVALDCQCEVAAHWNCRHFTVGLTGVTVYPRTVFTCPATRLVAYGDDKKSGGTPGL
jgi:hypothetical protein